MRNLAHTLVLTALLAGLTGAAAVTYSIPPDQLDAKKVFWGEPSNFAKPGEVAYEDVIKATPEYKELKEEKVEKGTGKYWILLSKASDRAVQAISSFGEDTEFDLIAAEGYLSSLNPSIPAEDVTKLIIKSMEDGKEANSKTARR
jgi:hypothetical protein